MDVVRYRTADGEIRIGIRRDGVLRPLPVSGIAELLAGDLARLTATVSAAASAPAVVPATDEREVVLAPIDGRTEVWAAGVTYLRSRQARTEESREADVYDRVYAADRPELFFKSVAWRVSGPGDPVAIRADSTMDVPEPELAVVVTASGEIAGYTVGNDMSSRSIEGENPLYLPQAKVYAGACALGPAIRLASAVPDPYALPVGLEVRRGDMIVWHGTAHTADLRRRLEELVGWLYAELDFPAGAVLCTGTGIVPELGFTLRDGDEVTIVIDGVGTLVNPVVRGRSAYLAAR